MFDVSTSSVSVPKYLATYYSVHPWNSISGFLLPTSQKFAFVCSAFCSWDLSVWVRLDERIHSTNTPSLIYLSVLHLDVNCFPPFGGCYEQRYNKRVFLCRCVPGRGGGCHSHQQAGVWDPQVRPHLPIIPVTRAQIIFEIPFPHGVTTGL